MDISCDKLNLLYLTNQAYKNKYNKLTEEKTKKSENFTKYTDEDIEFYRKRIFQLTKELLRGKNTNPSINNSFKHFANICIDHFQFEDAKEIYQKEYENLKTTNNGPKHFDASEVNKFMMKTEKPQEPRTIKDFLNIKTSYKEKCRKIQIPKRKKINYKNEKFRTKGIEIKK
jgi:hypothetical protein